MPYCIGARAGAWRVSEIEQWLAARQRWHRCGCAAKSCALELLRSDPKSTLQLRRDADILAPAARVLELKRDGSQFVLLPHVVLESPGYRLATHPARALLIDMAMQYTGFNNGKLVACAKYLRAKGWNSNANIVRARRIPAPPDKAAQKRIGCTRSWCCPTGFAPLPAPPGGAYLEAPSVMSKPL